MTCTGCGQDYPRWLLDDLYALVRRRMPRLGYVDDFALTDALTQRYGVPGPQNLCVYCCLDGLLEGLE